MSNRLRYLMIAAATAMCLPLGAAITAEPGAEPPRQSRPQQLAQSCRTQCIEEFNACRSTCDAAPTRIDCVHQCQTRLNVCNMSCR